MFQKWSLFNQICGGYIKASEQRIVGQYAFLQGKVDKMTPEEYDAHVQGLELALSEGFIMLAVENESPEQEQTSE